MSEPKPKLPTRHLRQQRQLSVIGMDAGALATVSAQEAMQVLTEAFDRGLNYIDLGSGTIEEDIADVLAGAISGRREDIFLAGRVARRDAAGAAADLATMLRRLDTTYLDLLQFDAIADSDDTRQIFSPNGAGKAFLKARAGGEAKMLGIVAHGVEASMTMMGSFPLDVILVPVNFVCYAQGQFGPQLLATATQRGIARLATDGLALTPWPPGERGYPACPYRPIDVPQLARQAVQFTMEENITAMLAPPDAALLTMAMDCADDLRPMSADRRQVLLESAGGLEPIFSHTPAKETNND